MSTARIESVIERIQQQARLNPDAVALHDLTTGSATYGDLMQRVASVAAALGDLRESAPVVVRCDWDLASAVNVLAVLWAGGAVVPISSEDPPERVQEVVARTGSTVLLHGAAGGTAGTLPGANLPHPLERGVGEARVVFFTSGSAGRPKAVVRSTLDLDRYVTIEIGNDDFLAARRTAVFMPLHFAAGFMVFLGGLAAGRFTALVDARRVGRSDLDEALTSLRIERLHMTPSLMGTLVSTARPGALGTVSEIWLGGERLEVSVVNLVRERFPGVRTLTTYYGASELTTLLAVHRIPMDEPCTLDRLPIGRPRNPSGVRVEPVPDLADDAGVVGELVVLGEVAQYYLGDPALTADRFRDEIVGGQQVRTWRSRDLVLLDPDGMLWPRGRLDDMVKINGRLVEPSETELALRRVPGVHDAAVTVRIPPSGTARLVAHVVVDDGVSADAVRLAMRRMLPGHQLPSVLMRHDTLPVNDRGKVDRAALRAVEPVPWRTPAPASEVDPRTSFVCAAAALELDLDEVLPDDNLWDLGLDSLAAIELMTSLSEVAGVELDPTSVVGLSTCRELAALTSSAAATRSSSVVVINDAGASSRTKPVFAMAGGGGTALAFRFLASELGPQQSFIVHEQVGLHRRARRDRTIDAAARRNLVDVVRRQPEGPYLFIGHSWGGLVAQRMAEIVRSEGVGGNHAVRLVVLDSQRRIWADPTPRRQPPPAIAEHRNAWPVWVLKWMAWRAHWLPQDLRRRWRRWWKRPGTPARYEAYARFAIRSARRHRISPLDVPGALVCPEGSEVPDQWADHPNLRHVMVGGGHNEMLRYPHVVGIAGVIREELREMVN